MFSFPIAALESQVARFFARICARAIFSGVTRIQTHNLNLARTLPYHWAIPSHVTNNVGVSPSGSPRGILRRVVVGRDSPGSERDGARNTRI